MSSSSCQWYNLGILARLFGPLASFTTCGFMIACEISRLQRVVPPNTPGDEPTAVAEWYSCHESGLIRDKWLSMVSICLAIGHRS